MVKKEVARMLGRSRLFVGVVAVTLVLSGVALGTGAAVKLSAKMTARQVVPQKPKGNVAKATGTFVGTLRRNGVRWQLSWHLTYKGLDHPSIVIADIHYGKPGRFGPIVVRLCGPCKSGQSGVKRVKAARVPAIKSGNTFLTLITGKNPNGEIRGQIKAA
jgi:CHRD domain